MNRSVLFLNFFFTIISIKTTSGHQPSAAIDRGAPAPRQPNATLLLGEAGGGVHLVLVDFLLLLLLLWPPATAVIF